MEIFLVSAIDTVKDRKIVENIKKLFVKILCFSLEEPPALYLDVSFDINRDAMRP